LLILLSFQSCQFLVNLLGGKAHAIYMQKETGETVSIKLIKLNKLCKCLCRPGCNYVSGSATTPHQTALDMKYASVRAAQSTSY
jgi:hypothetical protein